jgi:hypothetical protein
MIYTPEEVTAARAWLANPNRTGATARIALRAMGWTASSDDVAAFSIGRADYWAERMVGYADEYARLEAGCTPFPTLPEGVVRIDLSDLGAFEALAAAIDGTVRAAALDAEEASLCDAGECGHYTCTEGRSLDEWEEPEWTDAPTFDDAVAEAMERAEAVEPDVRALVAESEWFEDTRAAYFYRLGEAIERACDAEEQAEAIERAGDAATITIAQDGVWAGVGTLRNGVISECGAALGASYGADKNDDVEGAYRAIELAIALGRNSAEFAGCVYTWDIEVAEVAEGGAA